METYDKGMKPVSSSHESKVRNHGRLWAGLIVIAVGMVFLGRELGAVFPEWLFSWKMLVIAIGLYVGAKQSFKLGGWLIPVAIGVLFIVDDYIDELYFKPYLIPIGIIGAGLYIIFKPKRKEGNSMTSSTPIEATGDWESVVIFGENKNIISKDFKGGEMVTIFGGSELNMMQADINGMVTIEVVQIFGGTKLIVPSNWKIQTSELVSVFGGISDKRAVSTTADPTKLLNIKGASVFGGIDIRSY